MLQKKHMKRKPLSVKLKSFLSDIEREKIEAAEKQRKEEREAAKRHDQLL